MSVDEALKLVVCLGNPGEKYRKTRHNAGFMVADYLADVRGATWKKHSNMLLCDFGNWLLVKPQTFMNSSGEVFDELPEVETENILVLVDEINLPLGRIRLRAEGSAGGHNGLASIEYFLQSREYGRLRIGVGQDEPVSGEDLIDFVLGEFTPEEIPCLERVVGLSTEAVQSWLARGIKATQDEFNRMDLQDAD